MDDATKRQRRIDLLRAETEIAVHALYDLEDVQELREGWHRNAAREAEGGAKAEPLTKEAAEINQRCDQGLDRILDETDQKLTEINRARNVLTERSDTRMAQLNNQRSFDARSNRLTARANAAFKGNEDRERENER